MLLFLNACEGIDDAAKVIGKYYEIRKSCPNIFSNRDPLSAQVQQCLSNQYYFSLPTTPTGYSVIYHSLSNPKASNYMFEEACKTFFMLVGWFRLYYIDFRMFILFMACTRGANERTCLRIYQIVHEKSIFILFFFSSALRCDAKQKWTIKGIDNHF